mmetsp:Transcript_16697/g.32425  ORF Transcript_16697/g.32425 Transcript_16697/m.32425 type:complete len:226 (+) Transcript_16697:2093-2770(+)
MAKKTWKMRLSTDSRPKRAPKFSILLTGFKTIWPQQEASEQSSFLTLRAVRRPRFFSILYSHSKPLRVQRSQGMLPEHLTLACEQRSHVDLRRPFALSSTSSSSPPHSLPSHPGSSGSQNAGGGLIVGPSIPDSSFTEGRGVGGVCDCKFDMFLDPYSYTSASAFLVCKEIFLSSCANLQQLGRSRQEADTDRIDSNQSSSKPSGRSQRGRSAMLQVKSHSGLTN